MVRVEAMSGERAFHHAVAKDATGRNVFALYSHDWAGAIAAEVKAAELGAYVIPSEQVHKNGTYMQQDGRIYRHSSTGGNDGYHGSTRQ